MVINQEKKKVEFSNAIAVLCEKYGLNETEFANMILALNGVTEETQNALVICAMAIGKRTIVNQMSDK